MPLPWDTRLVIDVVDEVGVSEWFGEVGVIDVIDVVVEVGVREWFGEVGASGTVLTQEEQNRPGTPGTLCEPKKEHPPAAHCGMV